MELVKNPIKPGFWHPQNWSLAVATFVHTDMPWLRFIFSLSLGLFWMASLLSMLTFMLEEGMSIMVIISVFFVTYIAMVTSFTGLRQIWEHGPEISLITSPEENEEAIL